MTHDELLEKINRNCEDSGDVFAHALCAVVELHKPQPDHCPCCPPVLCECAEVYPCPTIQAIQEQLK